ncbi:hypothetical protein P8610_14515 [Fictibacillus sp. UD]
MNFIIKLMGSKKEKDSGCCKIEIKEIDVVANECCSNNREEAKCCE